MHLLLVTKECVNVAESWGQNQQNKSLKFLCSDSCDIYWNIEVSLFVRVLFIVFLQRKKSYCRMGIVNWKVRLGFSHSDFSAKLYSSIILLNIASQAKNAEETANGEKNFEKYGRLWPPFFWLFMEDIR